MMVLIALIGCDEPTPAWQDRDGDGYAITDCDDADPSIHPGAGEVCDGIDNDCDGKIDGEEADGSFEVYPDEDGDGYGPAVALQHACAVPDGFVSVVGDCDDADPTVHRGAAEVCDGADNDCDGLIDDDDGDVSGGTWYYDIDADGHAGSSQPPRCSPDDPWHWVEALPDDCDDLREAVYPGAPELCDDLDNDCDGLIDNDDSDVTDTILYPDLDGDGFGDPDKPSDACPRPADAVADGTDCDDDNSTTHPGAAEYCDEQDNDCDDIIDESITDPPTMYADDDGDGYGDPTNSMLGCDLSGWVYNDNDCDDTDPKISPELWWYADDDGDGFGDLASPWQSCTRPTGYTADATDCDDTDAQIWPDAPKGCGTSDHDCDGAADGDLDGDGLVDDDLDGDGFSVSEYCSQPDCDDTDASIWPGAPEVCGDGERNDCDAGSSTEECHGEGRLSDHITLSGDSSYDYAGRSAAAAGDVNGDGYSDLLIGAFGDSEAGNLTGAAHLVLGPVTGDLDLGSADAKLFGADRYDYAGFAVDGAGDVNDDGYDDLLIGAYGDDDNGSSSGAAYVVLGPVTGDLDLSSADARFAGGEASAAAGSALAAAGDLDGDGTDDLLIAAPGASASSGAVYLLHGPVSGGLTTEDAITFAGSSGSQLGSAMDAGDLDGDGVADLILSASGYASSRGRVYLFSGPISAGLSTVDATTTLTGTSNSDLAGAALAAVGDTNNDGYEDLLVGAYGEDNVGVSSGSAFLLLGPVTTDLTLSTTTVHATLTGNSKDDSAGEAVASAGDVDGDGYDDLIIGAYGDESAGVSSGAAYIVLGPITGTHRLSDIGIVLSGDGGDHAGRAVVGVGDMDGNGLDDVLVGAPDAGLTETGAAYLVLMEGL